MNHTTNPQAVIYDALEGLQGTTHHLPPGTRQAVAEHLARVLPAVSPFAVVSADRATLLRAAEALQGEAKRLTGEFNDSDILHEDGPAAAVATWKRAAEFLRRLAAETQRPSCPDPIECGHEAALGLAEERLDRVRAVAEAWARPSMSSQSRLAGEHLLRVLGTDAAPAAGEQPDTQTREAGQ